MVCTHCCLKYCHIGECAESSASGFGKQDGTFDEFVTTICSCLKFKDGKMNVSVV